MSDFGLLLLTAAASAYGTAAAWKLKEKNVLAFAAVVCFLLVGMHSVLFVALSGDGRILPGLQLHPQVKRLLTRDLPPPHAGFNFLALLAHLLVAAPSFSRVRLFVPAPATIVFVALAVLFFGRAGEKTTYLVEQGPERSVAYLTLAPERLVLSAGGSHDTFLRVLTAEPLSAVPDRPRVTWSADGEVVAFGVRVKARGTVYLRAFEIDGEGVGELPATRSDWPRDNIDLENARVTNSNSNVAVRKLLQAHGGALR